MKIRIFSEFEDEVIDISAADITDAEKIDEIVKEYLHTDQPCHWQVIEVTPQEQEEWILDLMRAHEG